MTEKNPEVRFSISQITLDGIFLFEQVVDTDPDSLRLGHTYTRSTSAVTRKELFQLADALLHYGIVGNHSSTTTDAESGSEVRSIREELLREMSLSLERFQCKMDRIMNELHADKAK